MFQQIKDKLYLFSERGMYFPFVYDPVSKKPSVTLLFLYLTFILAFTSIIVLHFKTDLVVASGTAILFWFLSFIAYRMRKIDSFKLDLKDQTIEIDTNKKEKE